MGSRCLVEAANLLTGTPSTYSTDAIAKDAPLETEILSYEEVANSKTAIREGKIYRFRKIENW